MEECGGGDLISRGIKLNRMLITYTGQRRVPRLLTFGLQASPVLKLPESIGFMNLPCRQIVATSHRRLPETTTKSRL